MQRRRQTLEPEPFFRGLTRIGSRDFTHQTYRVREHALAEVREWLGRLTPADFADVLVGLVNEAAGCEHTLTFDRSLKRIPQSKVI